MTLVAAPAETSSSSGAFSPLHCAVGKCVIAL